LATRNFDFFFPKHSTRSFLNHFGSYSALEPLDHASRTKPISDVRVAITELESRVASMLRVSTSSPFSRFSFSIQTSRKRSQPPENEGPEHERPSEQMLAEMTKLREELAKLQLRISVLHEALSQPPTNEGAENQRNSEQIPTETPEPLEEHRNTKKKSKSL